MSPRMVGWQIEIANDTQQLEPGVIKRVDADINCALVAFESGKKEWLDLTLSVFKVQVRHLETDHDQEGHENSMRRASNEAHTVAAQPNSELEVNNSNAVKGTHIVNEPDRNGRPQPDIPRLDVPTKTVDCSPEAIHFKSKPPPESDVMSFDWYSEGGHVEICDSSGSFLEGAILCAKTETHVHLYNEARQFFEISMTSQSFKVVIHGLLSLKWVPMGQAIEVYSAMNGGFHQGIAIKAAEVSKLTPVRFSSGAVEWLDLSTQTFKLVFLSEDQQEDADDDVNYSSSKMTASPIHKPHHHHNNHHQSPTKRPPELPPLHIGQRIEICEASSKQFVKYKVTAVGESSPHDYEFEPQPSLVALDSSTAESRIVANLVHLRCRIPLTPHMWSEHRHIITGHRIDVYDRAEKTVVSAKILEVGSREDDDQQAMLVRFKDGKKSWIHAHNVKVKLRLQGEPLDVQTQNGRSSSAESTHTNTKLIADEQEPVNVSEHGAGEMWERLPRIETPRDSELDQHQPISTSKVRIARHRSDLTTLQSASLTGNNSAEAQQLTHSVSAVDVFTHQRSIEIESVAGMAQKTPSIVQPLDFSSLRKLNPAVTSDEPMYSVTSGPVDPSSQSSRSSESSTRSSRLPFTMADVWREEFDSDISQQVQYVNNGSGVRQTQVPEWLERSDAASGRLFVVHTPSNTLYAAPTATATSSSSSSTLESGLGMNRVSASRANLSAPGSAYSSPLGDSGGRVVVPVGPIEAVRVYNMLDK